MRVGAAAVRNLAVTLCVTARMRERNVYGSNGQLLVDHGIGTAYLARLVAEEAGVDTEHAFLCGLLHDIGKMVILKWHYDHAKRTDQPLPPAELNELLARWHPLAAAARSAAGAAPRARRAGALPSRIHGGASARKRQRSSTSPTASVTAMASAATPRPSTRCRSRRQRARAGRGVVGRDRPARTRAVRGRPAGALVRGHAGAVARVLDG